MKKLEDKPTLKAIQNHLKEFCKLKGWDKKSDYEVFLLFSEEVGELAKAIRYETKLKSEKIPEDHSIEHELADVFNYLLDIANRFGVDLERAYRDKNLINQSRTWK